MEESNECLTDCCIACLSESDSLAPIVDDDSMELYDFLSKKKFSDPPLNPNRTKHIFCLQCLQTIQQIEGFRRQCQHARAQLLNKLNMLLEAEDREIKETIKIEPLDVQIHEFEDVFAAAEISNPPSVAGSNSIQEADINEILAPVKSRPKTTKKAKVKSSKPTELSDKIVKAEDGFRHCPFCSYKTKYPRGLAIHMAAHTDEERNGFGHRCDICERVLANRKGLYKHKIHVHSMDKQALWNDVECDLCKKTFSHKFYLRRHMQRLHVSNSFKCTECDRVFKDKFYLSGHMKRRHITNYCRFCDTILTELSPTDFHAHLEEERRKQADKNAEKQKHICDICGYTTIQLATLKIHIKTHQPETTDQRTPCDVCHKIFKHPFGMRKHREMIHGEKTVACEHCGARFVSQARLNKHLYGAHKLASCEICGESIRRVNLKVHIDSVHRGILPFKCNICGIYFDTRKRGIRHLAAHSSVSAFNCHICAKGYCDQRVLKNHYASAHNTKLDLKEVLAVCVRKKPDVDASNIVKV